MFLPISSQENTKERSPLAHGRVCYFIIYIHVLLSPRYSVGKLVSDSNDWQATYQRPSEWPATLTINRRSQSSKSLFTNMTCLSPPGRRCIPPDDSVMNCQLACVLYLGLHDTVRLGSTKCYFLDFLVYSSTWPG